MRRDVFVIVLVLSLANTAIAQRGADNDSSVIVVSGEGFIRVAPDQATVRIGILRQAATAEAAQGQANTVANEILSAITKVGIPSNQVQTSRLSLTPIFGQRGQEPNPTPRITAYQAY